MESLHKQIVEKAEKEFRIINGTLGIDAVRASFAKDLIQTYEASRSLRELHPQYNNAFLTMNDTLCKLFNIPNPHGSLTNQTIRGTQWGPAYWNYLHSASILIAYAKSKNWIESMLDFGLILFNIDVILLCNDCREHFVTSKSKDSFFMTLMITITGGLIVTGTFHFHNHISESISRRAGRINHADAYFSSYEFALKYHCWQVRNETPGVSSKKYWETKLLFEPVLHVLLCTLLSLYVQNELKGRFISYQDVSSFLKKNVYKSVGQNPAWNIPEEWVPYKNERFTMDMQHFEDALLLRYSDKSFVKENRLLRQTLAHLYSKYPKIKRQLLEIDNSLEPIIADL